MDIAQPDVALAGGIGEVRVVHRPGEQHRNTGEALADADHHHGGGDNAAGGGDGVFVAVADGGDGGHAPPERVFGGADVGLGRAFAEENADRGKRNDEEADEADGGDAAAGAVVGHFAGHKLTGAIQTQVEAALKATGKQSFATEYLFETPAGPLRDAVPEEPPFYETFGGKRVAEGSYQQIIRYRGHMLPLFSRMRVACGLEA